MPLCFIQKYAHDQGILDTFLVVARPSSRRWPSGAPNKTNPWSAIPYPCPWPLDIRDRRPNDAGRRGYPCPTDTCPFPSQKTTLYHDACNYCQTRRPSGTPADSNPAREPVCSAVSSNGPLWAKWTGMAGNERKRKGNRINRRSFPCPLASLGKALSAPPIYLRTPDCN